tara:strand:- start:264 stop:392 length:129 start_codon:yes stop_codon:yes gene_type:complete
VNFAAETIICETVEQCGALRHVYGGNAFQIWAVSLETGPKSA